MIDSPDYANVAGLRDCANYQLSRRVDYGISMTSSSVFDACHSAEKYFRNAPTGNGAGFPRRRGVFASREGERFMKPAEFS